MTEVVHDAHPIADAADTVELLGLVAHLQHVAFGRLAEDARVAPSTAQQLELSRLAAAAVARRDAVLERVVELGGDPERCLGAYARLMEDFDSRTQPSTWWERLLRSYVADGVSDDFCRIAAAAVDPRSRALLLEVLDDAAHEDLAVGELEAAGAQDEVLVSRLALWGRRLVGEALGVVQQAMAAHPGLGRLVTRRASGGAAVDASAGDGHDATPATSEEDAAAPARLFGELTAEHTRRMSRLGLTA
ncbi:ferritin-like fold-containing protein [Cellulomonas sp. C5510]|uniref:ferritin-like fold-containing protein n=1 Tax=Cellulomonas sp. C5510 TaxID=2871170 RepID=UPI001C95C018|nr:ferritin-like fold-containing protein [Cellulomonas sp. C5510]QZN84948.1 ferritin-like domain-containing protein [Cellulomonas sp. C5510]